MWNDLIIDVNGETVLLNPHGAAFCPAHRALIVADMHFEKGTSYARSGQFLNRNQDVWLASVLDGVGDGFLVRAPA